MDWTTERGATLLLRGQTTVAAECNRHPVEVPEVVVKSLIVWRLAACSAPGALAFQHILAFRWRRQRAVVCSLTDPLKVSRGWRRELLEVALGRPWQRPCLLQAYRLLVLGRTFRVLAVGVAFSQRDGAQMDIRAASATLTTTSRRGMEKRNVAVEEGLMPKAVTRRRLVARIDGAFVGNCGRLFSECSSLTDGVVRNAFAYFV